MLPATLPLPLQAYRGGWRVFEGHLSLADVENVSIDLLDCYGFVSEAGEWGDLPTPVLAAGQPPHCVRWWLAHVSQASSEGPHVVSVSLPLGVEVPSGHSRPIPHSGCIA